MRRRRVWSDATGGEGAPRPVAYGMGEGAPGPGEYGGAGTRNGAGAGA
ncbi:hypothetical protein GCM10023075_22970 [Streptosporangium album]